MGYANKAVEKSELGNMEDGRNLEHEDLSDAPSEMGRFANLAAKVNDELLAKEDLKKWSDRYRDAERVFLTEENKSNVEEFEQWEKVAANAFRHVKEAEGKVHFDSIYDLDAFERLSTGNEGQLSIEAYGGNFYEERIRNISLAVEKSGDDEAKEEKAIIDSLIYHVIDFDDIKKDAESKKRDGKIYWETRRKKHNALIGCINDIDKIALKYGQKPLIFREMKDNNFHYEEQKDYSGETNARAEYDRSAVEGYVYTAFSKTLKYDKHKEGNFPVDPNRSIIAEMHLRGED